MLGGLIGAGGGVVGHGLMFTAGGTRGLRRMTTVLKSRIRLLDLGSVDYRASVPRATRALRKGTLLGSSCVCGGCRLSYFTSSAKLRIRTLGKTPKICSTHCTKNRKRSTRTGVLGLLRRLRKGRGHGTRFHATVSLVLSKGRCLFRKIVGNRVVGRGHNSSKFNCSPVFGPRNCSQAFTRLKGSVGGRVDRHTLTMRGLYRFLRDWLCVPAWGVGRGRRGCFVCFACIAIVCFVYGGGRIRTNEGNDCCGRE